MKIKIEYTNEMLIELIKNDIANKITTYPNKLDVKIKVRSKQNYREKEWEIGELNCELEVDM
jgi:transcriptional regulator